MVGRLLRNIREHDRVVGGVDPQSTIRATSLYKPVLKYGKIIPMNARSAEVTKTAENAFRDLQIAAVNQLALYCEAMKINIFDIREGLASLKGEGISRGVLYPGSGVGGHCLTKDTYHLERGAKILGSIPDFPEGKESLFVLARHINDFMPEHMFHLTIEGLSRIDKEVSGAKITILGWAFINNSDDARNTPSETYRDIAIKGGAKVVIHDPYVTQYPGIRIEQDLTDALKNTDAVIIFTGHDIYRDLNPIELKEFSGKNHPVIVDGRNIIDPEQFIKNGFIYKGIGRGDKNFHLILGK
jgi:UDP-N-acetyl-D-mannosaminuronic acid dehydrogenase